MPKWIRNLNVRLTLALCIILSLFLCFGLLVACQSIKIAKIDHSQDEQTGTKSQTSPLSQDEQTKETSVQSNVYKIEFLDFFDTYIQIQGSEIKKEAFEKIGEEIYQKLQKMHQLFDIFHSYEGVTNLYSVNEQAGKGPIKIDPLLFELLDFSKKMYEVTKGRTNIAMGSLLNLWHEARIFSNQNPEKAYIPSLEDLKQAAKHMNIADIKLDQNEMTVEISDPHLRIDTGAIAKGFAAEKIAQELKAKGINHFLLNFGGNIRCIGPKNKQGLPWKIAIQNPDLKTIKPYLHFLEIESKSTVTSGVYERFFTYNGISYHHIIDGETLQPGRKYAGVSIITKDSGLADALSTAIFLLPEAEGEKLAKELGDVEILWVYPDGRQKYTPGFLKYRINE